jgi:hypothetical protein
MAAITGISLVVGKMACRAFALTITAVIQWKVVVIQMGRSPSRSNVAALAFKAKLTEMKFRFVMALKTFNGCSRENGLLVTICALSFNVSPIKREYQLVVENRNDLLSIVTCFTIITIKAGMIVCKLWISLQMAFLAGHLPTFKMTIWVTINTFHGRLIIILLVQNQSEISQQIMLERGQVIFSN